MMKSYFVEAVTCCGAVNIAPRQTFKRENTTRREGSAMANAENQFAEAENLYGSAKTC